MSRLADPELSRALEQFVGVLREALGGRLVSLVRYGSVVFDDLAPDPGRHHVPG